MKQKEPNSTDKVSTDKVKDLPPKPVTPKSADKIVGGRAEEWPKETGPGN
jgi:hypothetical protein